MTDLKTFGIHKGEGRYHEEIIYTVALLYNIVSADITHYLRDYDLSIGKLNILMAIKRHGQERGITQVEVSQHLIVTPSNMTKMIDKLEKDGLVTRSEMTGDRRANILKVTSKGTHLLDTLWEGYEEKLKQAIRCLTKEKQRQLSGLLTEWFEKLQ